MTLYELREEYKQLLILLEDEGADPEVIADTLEGMEGDINEKVDSYCIIAEQLSSDADRLRAEEVRLAKRRKSIEGNRDRLRAALLKAMLIMEKPQIKTDRYTVTVKATSGRLVIDDPLGIPEEYRMKMAVKCRLSAKTRALFRELLSEFSLDRKVTLTVDLNPLSM